MPADMLANTRASAPLSAAWARRASSRWALSSRRRSRVGVRRLPGGLGDGVTEVVAAGFLEGGQMGLVDGGEAPAGIDDRTGLGEPGDEPGRERDGAVEGGLVGVGCGRLRGSRRGGDAALEEDAGSSVVQPARPSAAAPDAAIAERRVAFTPATLSPGPAPDPGRYRG